MAGRTFHARVKKVAAGFQGIYQVSSKLKAHDVVDSPPLPTLAAACGWLEREARLAGLPITWADDSYKPSIS